MLENQVKLVYLGLGSNLGSKINNIERAKFQLIKNNIKILQSSSYYESLSWPNSKNPKFLNIVLKINTNLKPLKLLELCKRIEKFLGRKNDVRNSPRTCDIDILDYNNLKMNKNVILPHPRMHLRNFVLLPFFEVNKDWNHPILKKHIKTLLLSLSKNDIRSIKQI